MVSRAKLAGLSAFVFDGSPRQWFIHDGRLIYSLAYWIETSTGYHSTQVIVHLTPEGNSDNGHASPLPPNTRLVTTKPGQKFLLRGERKKVLRVEVWSAAKSLRECILR